METINFNKCTLDFMEESLGLRPHLDSVGLTAWISMERTTVLPA